MRALILDDGDGVRETTRFEDVTAAHAAGKTFWAELDERCNGGEALLATLGVHPLAAEDLWQDIGLPKVEDFGEYIQLVMHGVRAEDREGTDIPLELAELDVIIGKTFLVTHAHDERACAVAPMLAEIKRNPRLLKKGPAWVAHAVLDRLVDEYIPVVERFDGQIDDIETHILDHAKLADEHRTMRRILAIKRSLAMLRRTTIHQREILLRLARAEFDEIPREAVPFYRDVYDHFARVTEMVDGYRDLLSGLLEAHFSVQSNQMNQIMKRLTIISTVMLPLSLIAGIYGMNFERMPELKWRYGYPYALGLMVAVAAAIITWFRRKRWL